MMVGKRVGYYYTMNYHGGDCHEGRAVGGASITLLYHIYKDGKELLFDKEAEFCVDGVYLNNVYDVCFDRKTQFQVMCNKGVERMFCGKFGWNRITVEPALYSLDVACGTVRDEENGLPEEWQDVLVEEPILVGESAWRDFVANRLDDFDIPDNSWAQCVGISWCDVFTDDRRETKIVGK